MHNFVYHNPTKVLFGRATIASAGVETCALGRRVMLVFGRNSARRSGLLEQVCCSLKDAGAEPVLFGEVQPNPTLEHVRRGIETAKKLRTEAICALGGGSVIDSAKAIAAGSLVEHDVWKFFTGKKSVRQSLPLVAISTLAASGSEMNPGMVLTNIETRQKFGFAHRLLYPKVAIMDPESTYSVDRQQTAYGAVDAFSHLLEFYLTTTEPGTMVQDNFMEGLARSILDSCGRACAEPSDYQARATLMWSAGLALGGLSAAGLGKVGFPMHLIEHSLSALYDIAHGAGLGVVIPGWLRFHAELIPARMTRFFAKVFGVDGSQSKALAEGIRYLENWMSTHGIPTTLQEAGIPTGDIGRIAENALPLAGIWRMKDYDKEKIEKILWCCASRCSC